MRILFDHQIFISQIYGGISRYFIELMKNFENDNEIECELSLKHSNNYYLKKLTNFSYKTFFENFSFKGKYRLLNILNKRTSKKCISKGNYDIFHPTYYDPYFLEYIGNKPFVLTIYDMIHEIYPEMFSSKDKTSERKKILAQKATKIIAISENTKKDIIKFLGIGENKIEVIYLGNPFDINNSSSDKINIDLPEKYILFVGSRVGYKNFYLFVETITPLLIKDNELKVVCVGGGNFKEIEKEKFKRLNIIDKIYQYSVNDNILAYIYQKAVAFVFPSLYEGFGIPILESFACGCPVICSRISSLPEAAGDATIYFDPTDKLSMANNIRKVIYNDDLRKQLVNKGTERVKKFTWEKTAKQTKKIYESVF
jgi:glycosyltransferase involved in cell wall biosynthesis